jgi:hypothetical protein
MSENLTHLATAGYAGEPNPHLWSSASWYAHQAGAWLKDTGRTAPRNVRMSRGSKVHVNDMLVNFHDDGSIERIR